MANSKVNPGGPHAGERALGPTTRMDSEALPLANDTASIGAENDVPRDMFELTREEREQYGIAPDSEIAWVRSPEVWRRFEADDRPAVLQRMGARVVMHNGQPVTMGKDVYLVEIPAALREKREAARKQQEREFMSKLEKQDWEDQLDTSDTRKVRERVAENREAILRSGLAGRGSETSVLPLDAVDRGIIPKEQIELYEIRARRGSRSPTQEERERERELEARISEFRSKRSKNRFYSIP